MIEPSHTSTPPNGPRPDVGALWRRLTRAESALYAIASGQVDAIIDPSGKTYLLPAAEKEKQLQSVIDGVADGITLVNRGGEVVSQSHAVNRMLGYEPHELVGKSIFEFVHKDDVHTLFAVFFEVIEGFRESATAQFRHALVMAPGAPSRPRSVNRGMFHRWAQSSVFGPVAFPRCPRARQHRGSTHRKWG